MIAEIEQQASLAQLPGKFFDKLDDDFEHLTALLGQALLAAYLLAIDQAREDFKSEKIDLRFDEPVAKAGPASLRFDVPPEEAIDYFQRKKVVPRKQFDDLRREAQSASFTVSGIYKKDVLESFKEEIAQSLESGRSQQDVVKGFREILNGKGHRELGAFHLETVFRTNVQMSYGVGRRRALEEVKDDLPFWQYHAVLDDRTRPTHRALDGLILPADNEFWNSHFPPWDFNCRCAVTATAKMPDEYNHRNPSGEAEIAYSKSGSPAKVEYGTSVYDLEAGKFHGVPPQSGLKDTIEAAAEKAQESRSKQRYSTPKEVLDKEQEIRHDRRESLHFFDRDGKLLHSLKGKEDQVSYKLSQAEEEQVRGGIDTHNHPSSSSFSVKDVMDAARLEQVETRIISALYSYSMKPPAGGWDEEFGRKIERAFLENRDKVARELQSAMRNGELTALEAKLEERHSIWQKITRQLGLRYLRKRL